MDLSECNGSFRTQHSVREKGGQIGRALGLYGPGKSGAGLIMSIIGAVILLMIYRFIRRRRAPAA